MFKSSDEYDNNDDKINNDNSCNNDDIDYDNTNKKIYVCQE